MAFVPNGTIRLLAGVPLDNSYTHTLKYASVGAQTAAFMAKTKRIYEHCTYIRETSRIRVPSNYNVVIMCNYLMYQNADFNNKWFYAFITGVYYINDNATEIEFELDVMQTWAFDYTILPGLIERNHTADDIIGKYTMPEPLPDAQVYIRDSISNRSIFGKWDIVAYTTFDWNTWQPSGGSLDGNIYNALERTLIGEIELTYNENSSGDPYVTSTWVLDARPFIRNLITSHAELVDGLVALIMVPHQFQMTASYPLVQTITKPTANTPLISRIPRNKKLYTYPYYYLTVTDGSGTARNYRFEDFNNAGDARFLMYFDFGAAPSITCVPQSYKGSNSPFHNNTPNNYPEAIVMTGFPQCAWISDAFQTYLAQNQTKLQITAGMAMGSIGAGVGLAAATIATGGGAAAAMAGVGMASGGLTSALNLFASLQDHERIPPKMEGSITGTALMAIGEKAFRFTTYALKDEISKVYDDFFDMYGYAMNKIGVPNTDIRPYWCYVKMASSAISPSGVDGLPASDMRKIESVLNAGVTFWKDMANVGNYQLDNTV